MSKIKKEQLKKVFFSMFKNEVLFFVFLYWLIFCPFNEKKKQTKQNKPYLGQTSVS